MGAEMQRETKTNTKKLILGFGALWGPGAPIPLHLEETHLQAESSGQLVRW